MASKNVNKPCRKPLKPGNEHGKRRLSGSRNKATIRNKAIIKLQSLLECEAEAITRKAVEMALQGDRVALRICMERLIPLVKDRRVNLDLPEAKTAEDVNEAVSAVLGALARQEITPSEAQAVVSMLEVQRKAIETVDLEARVRALENGEL